MSNPDKDFPNDPERFTPLQDVPNLQDPEVMPDPVTDQHLKTWAQQEEERLLSWSRLPQEQKVRFLERWWREVQEESVPFGLEQEAFTFGNLWVGPTGPAVQWTRTWSQQVEQESVAGPQRRIVCDFHTCSGKPRIEGTRLDLVTLADMTRQEVAEGWPNLMLTDEEWMAIQDWLASPAGRAALAEEKREDAALAGPVEPLSSPPWPPLSREQVVDLHCALSDWSRAFVPPTRPEECLRRTQEQLAADGFLRDVLQSLNIGTPQPTAPKPEVKRNCWTCANNIPGGPMDQDICAVHCEASVTWARQVGLDQQAMPPKDSDGCPRWTPRS